MQAKRIIPVIAVVAIGAAAYAAWSRYSKHDDPNVLRLSGNIELTQVDIAFKIPGRLIERTVTEGDRVAAGQLLAKLDREILEDQRHRDSAGVRSAETTLAQLRTAILFQRESIARDGDIRKADLAQAQAVLSKLLAGSRPQEIQSARAAVEDTRSQLEQAKADWGRAQTLFKSDDITRAQFDQFKARFESTAAVLKRAEENLALAVEGSRKEDIDAARAQLERAKAAIGLNEAQWIDLKRHEQELATREAEIDRARAIMKMSESQLSDTTLFSPVNGIVLTKSADVGEVLAAGTTILSVGDMEHPWLRGYIAQQDLGRVKLGAPVRLRTDSYPGKDYWGRLTFISSEAEFTPKQIQTPEERVKLVYRVKIEAANPNQELKLNMPVDAEIRLGQ